MRSRILQVLKRADKIIGPERLFLLALLRLNVLGDDTALLNAYRKHRYKAATYISQASKGTYKPAKTEFQESLLQLVPLAKRINLYIAAHQRGTPSHALSLVRDDKTGLFRASGTKIRFIPSGDVPRDGILVYWSDFPDPDAAVIAPIHLKRVVRGGRATAGLMQEIEQDWELSRQLTHCILPYQMVLTNNASTEQKISLWHSSALGKAVMSYKSVPSGSDPRLTPYSFEGLRIRADVAPGEKPNAIIYVDADAELFNDARGQQSRYFGVCFKRAPEADLPTLLEITLKEILITQIVPVVGVMFEGEPPVHIYALHYDPKENLVRPVELAHLSQQYLSIPALNCVEGKNVFAPNYAMVNQLLAFLLEKPDPRAHAHANRIEALNSFLRLMSRRWSFIEMCERHHIALSDEDRAILNRLVPKREA